MWSSNYLFFLFKNKNLMMGLFSSSGNDSSLGRKKTKILVHCRKKAKILVRCFNEALKITF
jgi:hypothetical protein